MKRLLFAGFRDIDFLSDVIPFLILALPLHRKINRMENKLPFNSIIPIQVRFNDVDMLGHVSNTVYQNYYDAGKSHYFEEVLPEMDFVKIGVVAASVKIDYLKPIYMKTRILVETHVVYIGNKSLTMEHQLVEEITGDILSTCSVVLVCYDFKNHQSIPLPGEWKKQIMLYDKNVRKKPV